MESYPVQAFEKRAQEKPLWSKKERELFTRVQRFVNGGDWKEQVLDGPWLARWQRKKEAPAERDPSASEPALPVLPGLWETASPKDPELAAMKEDILRTVYNNDSAN